MATDRKGRVQTVTGLVDPSDLGITLTHEHLLVDLNPAGTTPRGAGQRGAALSPYGGLADYHARMYQRTNLDDERLDGEEEAIRELAYFQRAGGGAVVDATTIGIGPDPLAYARIARATGVRVIRGAGYYTMEVPQPGLDAKSEAEITGEIVQDIEVGVGWPANRAGIIGEIASSWPRHPNEEKVLRAAVAAQRDTGAPLLIHPGRNPEAPQQLMELIIEAGGDASRTIMSHIDRTIFDYDTLGRLAETGCYIEYDLFGQESSYYPYDLKIDMPNDGLRIQHIQWLFTKGYGERVLVAHDICNKHRLRGRGGHGYAHLIENVAPVMLRRGLTDAELRTVFVANPARILAFA